MDACNMYIATSQQQQLVIKAKTLDIASDMANKILSRGCTVKLISKYNDGHNALNPEETQKDIEEIYD